MKIRTGQCQCGEVCYESAGEPVALYVCHCLECQKQSASAFGISLDVWRAGFRLTQGTPNYWHRFTDNGRKLICAFCPTCGSRLWHDDPTLPTISLKGGSLDESLELSQAVHVWCMRKLNGVIIPRDAKQFSEEN